MPDFGWKTLGWEVVDFDKFRLMTRYLANSWEFWSIEYIPDPAGFQPWRILLNDDFFFSVLFEDLPNHHVRSPWDEKKGWHYQVSESFTFHVRTSSSSDIQQLHGAFSGASKKYHQIWIQASERWRINESKRHNRSDVKLGKRSSKSFPHMTHMTKFCDILSSCGSTIS